VDALEEFPHVILAHSWTALIDASGTITKAVRYPLATSSPIASERFRSVLYENGGDDDGAVIRMSVLRRIPLLGSYHHSDRTLTAGLALQGPFYQVPDFLYLRRDHDERAERAFKTVRTWCANLDPRRADALRNPAIRLYAEYLWAFVTAIQRAPLSPAEKRSCYRHLAGWLTSRVNVKRGRYVPEQPSAVDVSLASLDVTVPGREGKLR
jgi:hypothetical protein